ncbi:hypothetical protein KBD59_03115 [Candidatus Gracilibacteria bacterium]|nr:hypothetical protein [Candidatus Gracilibacteria bacterium]
MADKLRRIDGGGESVSPQKLSLSNVAFEKLQNIRDGQIGTFSTNGKEFIVSEKHRVRIEWIQQSGTELALIGINYGDEDGFCFFIDQTGTVQITDWSAYKRTKIWAMEYHNPQEFLAALDTLKLAPDVVDAIIKGSDHPGVAENIEIIRELLGL